MNIPRSKSAMPWSLAKRFVSEIAGKLFLSLREHPGFGGEKRQPEIPLLTQANFSPDKQNYLGNGQVPLTRAVQGSSSVRSLHYGREYLNEPIDEIPSQFGK